MESALATTFPPDVVKVMISVAKKAVWNELLEPWIFLGSSPVHEKIILWIENGVEIAVHICFDALKRTQLIEKRAGDYENLFTFVVLH